MSGSSIQIPEGFLFRPSDQELLLSYLRRRLLRQPLPWEGIVEVDLYGEKANPWDLFTENDVWNILVTDDDDDSSKAKKTVYVFTKLSKLGKQGNKNIIRTAGCGKWHGHTAPKDIVKGKTKTKIGSKRMFTFKSSKKDFDGKGHWIMHEYSLSDAGLIDIGSTDYVVCRITKDESKNFKKKEDSEIILVSEADTQALGKRKSREEIYIPQEEKTPRWSFPDEHHVTIGVDTDMLQGNLLAKESFVMNTTVSKQQLPWYAGVMQAGNETATRAMEESIQENMAIVDATLVNTYLPEDLQHSIADPESLPIVDDMRQYAEFDSSSKPDHISNGIDASSVEESVQINTENDDDDYMKFASNLEDMLPAENPVEPDHISNEAAILSMEGSVQNNTEDVDVFAANTDINQVTEASVAEFECLLEKDEKFQSYLNDILY